MFNYILSVLQCWKATDIKTGWWQGKSQDFFVTSSAWRQKPTLEKENQYCCYCCDYNIRFNHLECSVSYIATMMCMLTKAPRKVLNTFEKSAVGSRHY